MPCVPSYLKEKIWCANAFSRNGFKATEHRKLNQLMPMAVFTLLEDFLQTDDQKLKSLDHAGIQTCAY